MPGNAVLGHWGSNCGAVQEAVDEEEHLCLGHLSASFGTALERFSLSHSLGFVPKFIL